MKRNFVIVLVIAFLVGLPPVGFGYFNVLLAENLRRQSPGQASAHYQTAARLLFWERQLHEEAGLAAFEAGDSARAEQLLLDAQDRKAISSTGLLALGDIYWQKGEYDTAYAQSWKLLSETDAASPALLTRLAAYARYKQDIPLEITHLLRLIDLEPGNAPAHSRLGILLAIDQPEAARAHLEQAATLDASLQPAANLLRTALEEALAQEDVAYRYILTGRALASLDEWRLALEAFRAAAQHNPDYAEAWAWQAEALFQLDGQAATIENYYVKALTLNPNSAGIQAMTGLYWERKRNDPQAETHYQRAAELEPQNPAWRLALAGVVARRDLPAALELYLAATQLAPDDVSTWVALAAFSIENEAYLSSYGLEAALRAYALEPENPQALALLGRALAASGEMKTARIIYEKAIALDPDWPAPRFHLAMLHLQMNQRAEARAALEQVLRLDPGGLYGQQAQEILARYFP